MMTLELRWIMEIVERVKCLWKLRYEMDIF